MVTSVNTELSLLVRIRDESDRDSWNRFVELYAPLVYGYLRKRGLQDADAADLTQDVMLAVATACKSFDYDRSKGSFRGWLFTIVNNRFRNFLRQQQHQATGTGDTQAHQFLSEQPGREHEQADEWDQEFHKHLFQQAAAHVRGDFQETTWQAFWRTTVQGEQAQQVAHSLGITVAAVYMAKRRVIASLQQHIRFLQDESL